MEVRGRTDAGQRLQDLIIGSSAQPPGPKAPGWTLWL